MMRNTISVLLSKFHSYRHLNRLSRKNLSSSANASQDATSCRSNAVPEDPCKQHMNSGLVLGLYTNPDSTDDHGQLTPSGERYDKFCCGRLSDLLRFCGPPPNLGEVRVFYNTSEDFSSVAVAGLGERCLGYHIFEQIDESKEAIRIASATGCRALQDIKVEKILIESFGHAESSAEGAALGVWLYQERKNKKEQKLIPQLELYDDCDLTGWQIGLQKAAAQNLARQLTDTPANLMTPTLFSQNAVEVLCKSGINVEVKVKHWCETQKMNAFLAVAQGSCEPPIFLELSYYGTAKDERPIILIGSGLTYNSGGLSLRPHAKQYLGRGEIAGAACVLAACRAAAALELPLNIRALIPLCEYMPGCASLRPGDIVRAMNGKTILVQTTEAGGQLTMVDALVYAKNFWPRLIVDIGTMSMDIKHALGTAACGVYSNSEVLWEYMLAASMHTGDKVWRFPLWDHYAKLIRYVPSADIKTFSDAKIKRNGESLCAAALLNEFVPCGDWLHMDICGITYTDGCERPYLQRGMTGRPTRTLVEFLSQLVCNRE